MSSVELIDVHKSYEDVEVVRGISLRIEPGEMLVLVGPSGCGKSTTLRMIAGLEDLTSGELRIGEQRMNEVSPRDRDIGMVFQSYALYPHMSVFDNIAFGLTLRSMPRAEIQERVASVATMLGLAEFLQRKPGKLSGGQRQRVAMGRAIARQPRLFLFDEPLSNLDAALRVQMRAELQALHARLGVTMIYVTHDQVEAMTLADRIAILDQGILQQVGPPLELYQRPANRFVAGFIGSPGMNFLDGDMAAEAGIPTFVSPALSLPLDHLEGTLPQGGSQVSLGLRPHDLEPGEGALRGEVEAVEAMGWEAFAHVRVGEQLIITRLQGAAAATVRRGEVLSLRVIEKRGTLFDAQGQAVGHSSAGD